MIAEEEVLEEGMVERIDAIELRMGRLEESVKSFKLEFRQLLRTEMAKHVGHIPAENLSSDWSVFPIPNVMKENCGTEFHTDAKSEKGDAMEKKETNGVSKDVILVAEKPEKGLMKSQSLESLISPPSQKTLTASSPVRYCWKRVPPHSKSSYSWKSWMEFLHLTQAKEKHENHISVARTLPPKPPDIGSFVKHLLKQKPSAKPPDLSESVVRERVEKRGKMKKMRRRMCMRLPPPDPPDACYNISLACIMVAKGGKDPKKLRQKQQFQRGFKEKSCRPSSRDSKNEDVQQVRLFEVGLSNSQQWDPGRCKSYSSVVVIFQENELQVWFVVC